MRNVFVIFPAALLVGFVIAAPQPKPILGAVAEFRAASREIGIKPDQGELVFVKVGPETDVLQIRPGERDLKKAEPAKVTDIARGDRVLVSFVQDLEEARRIVVISATDIVKRNEAVRLDWQQRGLSGAVTARNGAEITLANGAQTATVVVTEKTIFRRYAPDSVRFADALPGKIEEIGVGDQLRARGEKSEDGLRVKAEEIVFGAFLTRTGKIQAVNPDAQEITIEDGSSKQQLIVRLTPDTRVKVLPDIRAMFA